MIKIKMLNYNQWLFFCLPSCLMLTRLPGASSWPEGTFGLPMPKQGCPLGNDNDWETGSRTQVTEKGSHASENVHLAGIVSASAERIVQLFCVKMFFPQEGGHRWMPGKYCIFKKGDCPEKFQEGFIRWDDAASWYSRNDGKQTSTGVLPDGVYNYNTEIHYCCRTDGSSSSSIQLPPAYPFYLLKYGDVCQEVEDMMVSEEWVYWADEKSTNLNSQGGVHPKVVRSRLFPIYTKLFYCYYQPKPASQVRQVMMILVYLVAGTVVITSVVCVITYLAKKVCLRGRKRPANTSPSPDQRSPHASASPPSNPPHVYRYTTIQTNEDGAGSVTPSAPPMSPSGSDLPGEAMVILRDQDFRPTSLPPSYEEVMKQQAVVST